MSEREQFFSDLSSISGEPKLLDFCRRRILHGTPAVFCGDEDAYYQFRKRIADHFSIYYYEVYVTGSASLGFSLFKNKEFDYDSDIDVALVSADLYDRIMNSMFEYQMQLREYRKSVSIEELTRYHKFLEYGAIGWMRPDLLPLSFQIDELRSSWFDFFASISHGAAKVGNYKVTGGAFKSHDFLERYILSGLASLQAKVEIGALYDRTD